jgi:hypothetical protein
MTGRSFGGILLIAVAVPLGGYGIWLIASEDLQGGRDAVGAMFLGFAALAAIAAVVVLGGRGRGA